MTEFINMWKNYANFKDRTTVRGYWMAYLFYFISLVALAVICTVLTIVTDSLIFWAPYYLYALASFIPALAMAIRRLRDAGKEWYFYLVGFIPFVGIFILIYFLVQRSVADDGTPVV